MPSSLEAPVLQVDANVIHKVDTSNPQNLFSMWTVFARCADSVAQGRRLENLSWRLWTRETFCVDSATCIDEAYDAAASANLSASATSKPTAIPSGHNQHSTEELPQLSGSVDSVVDEEAVEFPAQPGAVEIIRPRILRQDSCGSSRSRGRERHITSDDLEKMVVSIVCEQEPLKAPLRSIPSYTSSPLTQHTEAPAPAPAPGSAQPATIASPAAIAKQLPETHEAKVAAPEETQEPAEAPAAQPIPTPKNTTVIRGFSPSYVPASMPRIVAPPAPSVQQPAKAADSDDANAIPEPTSAPAAKPVVSKKATFALGGSSSCEDSLSDPSQSLEMRKNSVSMMKRKLSGAASGLSNAASSSKNASVRAEEEGGSLKSALHLPRHGQAASFAAQKKQTSFSNQLITGTIPSSSAVFDDDDQTDSDDIDESAIDDDEDDSSDWEDQNEDSGRSSVDDKTLFQRVDSTVRLPSRPSLITLMLQKSEQEVKNGLTMSQSTIALPRAHNGSLAPSPTDSDEAGPMMRPRVRGPQSNLRPINEIPRSAAMPIMSTATAGGNYQAAYSPRTNRRNMLSTELTESLRRQLLWERSHKTSTANAVLKRRHTSHDVANLKQYPEVPHMKTDYDASSWDQYLNRDAFNGYHAKGW